MIESTMSTTAPRTKLQERTILVARPYKIESAWSLYLGQDEATAEEIKILQFVSPVRTGQRWIMAGTMKTDERGTAFVAQWAALAIPTTFRQLGEFLSSGHIDGWDMWSWETLRDALPREELIDACTHPERLAQIAGITPEMIASLQTAWKRGSGMATLFAQLAEWGCTSKQAEALLKYYGASAVDRLAENPYRDLREISGYGWKTADSIGKQLEIATDDPRRIAAGLETAVHEDTWKAGHTWLYQGQATQAAVELLNLPQSNVAAQVDTAVASAQLIRV